MLVARYLARTPHQLDQTSNGREALDRVKSGDYDLVLLDMDMPVMDGFTAAAELRAWESRERPEAPPLPVVALTAYALEDHRRRCFEAGCDGHLTKPITKAALLETIERFARPQPSS
ncbi:MAG TPA: response regulator [Planctomycetes bacterium]|nr:response regulator [Planctomycetota bacterium]